ncbi:ribonuclease D [Salinispirillum sp. LH 10-3-1]|uniref:Ribonuclease D n=1 Tax=Salinispirillum sp. LH 10-3-1 TaxID=2952525 RepID=A0AB38YJW5_9GAMM
MTDYIMITDDATLREHCARWQQELFIAVDTEFVRRRTYYPELGLLQVGDGTAQYLIDPLEINDLSAILHPLLTDPNVIKVFHSGEEDLEIFSLLLREPLQGGFDSQLAVGFLGGRGTQSYAGLVADELGIDVPKDQTQSNWLARPLTDAQCAYAANDVNYLYRIYPALQERLDKLERFDWVREDVDRLATKLARRDALDHYQNLRQAWQLKGNKLWLIQQLAARREERCQELNLNRKALISDNDLVTLALKRPTEVARVAELTEIKPSVLRKESDWIFALIKASHNVAADQFPAPIQGPLRIQYSPAFQSARELLTGIAEEAGLPREYLYRKKDLETVVVEAVERGVVTVPESWQGWRWALYGDALTERLLSRFGPEATMTEEVPHD